ncbi:MAG: SusC/RagA family TonB-linked outer membrane protein [Tannerellaceae bacterium]|nr:SusC/RagA family TonB-linked outer membrane protein [Tannerellaceae bacterium]
MSVQLQNTTLRELFDLIEEKFDYSFLIRNNDIDLDERITIDMTDHSVEEILKNALKNQDAEFVVNENRIIVYKASVSATHTQKTEVNPVSQQTIKVTGVVIDAMTGEPVIGANLLIKDSSGGTSTDFDGNFTIEVPPGTVLIVSYIGYNHQEVVVQSTPMTIRLREDTKTLDEVVVVGYTVQRRESLTGAMQVVSGETLNTNTTPSVENMLVGKSAGVSVTPGSGQPGASGKVVIRGKSTINGSSDPLWVIDGVIVGTSSGDLNPADIASMSILKDAASTAIYGSQGANGVIVVTTKKGRTGKAAVQASIKLGVNQLTRGNVEMMNGAELYDYFKSFHNQDKITFARYDASLRNANYDWFKEGTKLGFTQDYNVSVSGGSEKIKTYISVGYYNEEGAVKDYDYSRYNFRFNVDYDVTDWLKVKPQMSASRRDIMDQAPDVSVFYSLLPWNSPYDSHGDLLDSVHLSG